MTRLLSLAILAALSPFLVAADDTCSTFAVDFGQFQRGDYITTQLQDQYGIEVVCASQTGFGCRIFDTAVPWGNWTQGSGCFCKTHLCSEDKKDNCGDKDLGSPHKDCPNPGWGEGSDGGPGNPYPNCEPRGNVLIIDENGPDKPPDDSLYGGKIRFLFDFPTDLDKICFLDVDAEEQTYVSVYFHDGRDPVLKEKMPRLGDGGYGCIDLPYTGVSKLNVIMDGSGSVSDLSYKMCGKKKGGGGGDPHFKRWNRERSTFHGECDMVMAHSDKFHGNAGFDMHVRSTIRHDLYSYFKSAAIRVGQHILEVTKDYVLLDGSSFQHEDLPLTFGDDVYQYTIDNTPIEAHKDSKNRHYYKLDLGEDSSIKFEWYRHLLNIEIHGDEADFADSVGMLGEYHTGDMYGRDGRAMTDFNEYGFEWQVDPGHDPMLFADARAPQLPYERCRMPSNEMTGRRRRLRADKALVAAAEQACSNKLGSDIELCIQDVIMTGDVEMANAW